MVRSVAIRSILMLASVVFSAEALAQGRSGIEIEQAALRLTSGGFVWAGDGAASPASPVRIVISIPMQMAFVYRGDALIAASTVSTGKRGKETPVGEFTILEKRQFHRSNLYSNAPMPFMQRLTWDGIALHGGELPGYPASHGCIRLPMRFAQKLFALTTRGAEVAVIDADIPFPAFRPELAPPRLDAGPELLADERLALATPVWRR